MFGIRKASLALALGLLLLFGAVALAQGAGTVQVANNPQLGKILTDAKGMTLYFYTKDTPGVSNCTGACLAAWPPLTVTQGTTPTLGAGVTAKLGTITRPDGAKQVTANDLPLYYWAKDKAPGDVTGQGVGGIWFVSDPAGNMVKTALAAATPGATATAGAGATATRAPTTAAAAAGTAATATRAAAPGTLPTTGGSATDWLLPLLAFVVVFGAAGIGLNLARRTR